MGAAKLGGEDLNYLGVSGLRIAGGQGVAIIAVCQVVQEASCTLTTQNDLSCVCTFPAMRSAAFLH